MNQSLRSLKPGTLLCWAANPGILFRFKGYGHRGQIIATLLQVVPGYVPNDVIGRQKDFLRCDSLLAH